MCTSTILLADDESNMLSMFQEWLEEDGYQVYPVVDGQDALRLFFDHKPMLSITDLRMPNMDGFQLISRIREVSDAHVLVVTALGDEEHMIRGLDLGADDYMVKPVSRRVFLARVRSLMKRAVPGDESPPVYDDGLLKLDYLTHEAHIGESYVKLRPMEFKLLGYLVQNQDHVAAPNDILDGVWGQGAGSLDSLKWYVSALRAKIEEDPANPELILTVPRVGYRYCPRNPTLAAEVARVA